MSTHWKVGDLCPMRGGTCRYKCDVRCVHMPLEPMPDDSATRKATPLATGCLDYFPLALTAVARLSKIGNDKHNPGEPLHWSREKSNDHANCILRHMLDRGTIDTDGELHDVKVAWRALAMLQLAEEKRLGITP